MRDTQAVVSELTNWFGATETLSFSLPLEDLWQKVTHQWGVRCEFVLGTNWLNNGSIWVRSLTNSSTPSNLVSLVDSDYISVQGISPMSIFSTFWHIRLLLHRFRPGLVTSSTKTLLTTFNPLELLCFSHPGCHYHYHTRRSTIQRRGMICTNAIHCLDFGLFVTFSVFAHVPMGETQSEVAGGSDEKNVIM